MNASEFDKRAQAIGMGGRACTAARLVLVDGMSRYAAAHKLGVNISAVSRAAKRVSEMNLCKLCGRERA